MPLLPQSPDAGELCSMRFGLLPVSEWAAWHLHRARPHHWPLLRPKQWAIIRSLQQKELSWTTWENPSQSQCAEQIFFMEAETWASFTISHSSPHGLICLCHRSIMSELSVGLKAGIMFSSAAEVAKGPILSVSPSGLIWVCCYCHSGLPVPRT